MCIRDRYMGTHSNTINTMLKPKAVTEFLEKAKAKFKHYKNIFLANVEGSLLAATDLSNAEKTFTASFISIWCDYNEIMKASSEKGDEIDVPALNMTLMDYDKGRVVLAVISQNLILGLYTEDFSIESAILLQEAEVLKNSLEPQFNLMFK
eukprot:TRINITY_DN205_c0_g1_i1.p2 TRINITY_DN205_c0_g1~~TRINITY_DN205_c0_g1_i1.p2  ORF type:complete len:174 (+),score=45.32 TRINITY_DN205_c0_g1_i1:72-524(+)